MEWRSTQSLENKKIHFFLAFPGKWLWLSSSYSVCLCSSQRSPFFHRVLNEEAFIQRRCLWTFVLTLCVSSSSFGLSFVAVMSFMMISPWKSCVCVCVCVPVDVSLMPFSLSFGRNVSSHTPSTLLLEYLELLWLICCRLGIFDLPFFLKGFSERHDCLTMIAVGNFFSLRCICLLSIFSEPDSLKLCVSASLFFVILPFVGKNSSTFPDP